MEWCERRAKKECCKVKSNKGSLPHKTWIGRYRVPIKQEIDENDTGHYEGRIVDKRIGGQDGIFGVIGVGAVTIFKALPPGP